MREEYYTNNDERGSAIKKAESQGETMLHDDFSVGPGGKHRLTFDTLPKDDTTKSDRLKALTKELINDTITFDGVKELLRLERALLSR